MAKVQSPFSLKHLLVLSLALNISLVSRVFLESEKLNCDSERVLSSKHSSSVAQSNIAPEIEDCEGKKIVNLDHGDPTMYEKYWQEMGEKTTIVIKGWHSMSYFSDPKSICWFLEPELAKQVLRLHRAVGNAETENRHVIVGTGSSQLYLAALYALSSHEATEPISVVSAAPYYSSYPLMTDYQKSGLHKWAGDANTFDKPGPYIELVTTPNNPDGLTRYPVVNRTGALLIHDLAYFWPQYTPISSPADNEISLFTVSKSTGHAGMRIGWALVKDPDVAKRMTKFVELNTIGVSKDSQIRAAKVIEAVANTCETTRGDSFFTISYRAMEERWGQLRAAVEASGRFSLPEFSPGLCRFHGHDTVHQPAFAWLRCLKGVNDCESFLRGHGIITRGGRHFGSSPQYVRVSMLDRDENYMLFLKRLSAIQ